MFISMWMNKDLVTARPSMSVMEMARLMRDKDIRCLPVVDLAGKILGMVSSQDLLHACPVDVNPFSVTNCENDDSYCDVKLTAADIMSPLTFTTAPDQPIEQVAVVMIRQKIAAAPVMLGERMVGIITDSDLFRALIEVLDPGTPGVRITFDNSTGKDVFPLIARVTSQNQLRVMSFASMSKHERPLCVVQVTGAERGIEIMLNDIWKSQHQVVSVIHVAAGKTT